MDQLKGRFQSEFVINKSQNGFNDGFYQNTK